MNKVSCTTLAISISTLLSGSVLASEEKAHTPATSTAFSGNFRVGFISAEDDDGEEVLDWIESRGTQDEKSAPKIGKV